MWASLRPCFVYVGEQEDEKGREHIKVQLKLRPGFAEWGMMRGSVWGRQGHRGRIVAEPWSLLP